MLTLLRHLSVLSWQLDEDDISQSLLGVVGDANGTDVGSVIEDNVFVVLGVAFSCSPRAAIAMTSDTVALE